MLKSKIFVGSLVGATAFSAIILSSSTVSAETYTKSALIRVQAACTMDGTVTTAHSATIAGGTYREGIGESIVSITCNDAGGFGVYAIGFTGDTDGNNVLAHGTEDVSIATGTATSGNTSNWAMKLEAYENGNNTPTIENGYDSYKVVPSDYTLVASYPNATSATDDVIFRTYYSAYIAMTQRAGTYTGKVKYVMVHPSTGPAPEKEVAIAEPVLPDPCDSDPNCDSTSGITLQAAYEQAYVNNPGAFDMGGGHTKKGLYYPVGDGTYAEATNASQYERPASELRFAIQDIDLEINGVKVCDYATVVGSRAYVLDLRDYKSYWIAKLADGRCWLQENLALDPLSSVVSLTPSNTNATQDAIDNFKSGGNVNNNVGWTTVAVSYSNSYSYDQPLVNIESVSVVPQGANDPLKDLANSDSWNVGIYYNLCATSVGTYCYASGQGVDKNLASAIDVDQDLCPAGWRIPTGGSVSTSGTTTGGGEYKALTDAYPSINNGDSQYTRVRKALRLSLPGLSGGIGRGAYGYYYSSTYYDDINIHGLFAKVSSIDPQSNFRRSNLYSVRCIAK